MKHLVGECWIAFCAICVSIFVAGPAFVLGYLAYTFKQGWEEGSHKAECDEAELNGRLDYYDAEK